MITAEIHLIDNIELFNRLVTYSKNTPSEYMFYDVETDGLQEKTVRLFGMGVCFTEQYSFYIVWRNKEGNLIWTEQEQQSIISWLYETAKVKKLVGHNIKYDILVTKSNLNIDLTEFVYSDTILQKHTLNENPPHSLKVIAVEELGLWADDAQDDLKESVIANGGKWNKSDKDMYLADTEILGKYCAIDVILTMKLFHIYEERLKKENLFKFFYEDEVIPLYKLCTIPMKDHGVPVNVPHYESLKEDISTLINTLEKEINEEIEPELDRFIEEKLDKEIPIKHTGTFPKELFNYVKCPIPIDPKKNKETMAAGALKKQKLINPEFTDLYDWVINKTNIKTVNSFGPVLETALYNDGQERIIRKVRESIYKTKKNQSYMFNIASSDDLAYYFFKIKGYKCIKMTKGTNPKESTDEEVMDYLNDVVKDSVASKIVEHRKLSKLLSTYVIGILDRQINGVLYPDMLQNGTTSGRYACRNPNMQNIPSIKDEEANLSPIVLKYANELRRGIYAPKGRKIVNADFSSLEVICFAHMSNSESLRDVFRNGEDLYSKVAIEVNKLTEYSANKKAPNYLKKLRPDIRQTWKVPPLGIVYGMGEGRLVQAIGCSYEEAKKIISDYLNTYPELKKYMRDCEYSAKTLGYVETQFGRRRNLPEVKELYEKYGNKLSDKKWVKINKLSSIAYKYKTLLNNAKNFPIQGLAAHIVNRAMITIAKEIKEKNLNSRLIANTHDELTYCVIEEEAEQMKEIMQRCMENTTKISAPLTAEPLIADTWADAK